MNLVIRLTLLSIRDKTLAESKEAGKRLEFFSREFKVAAFLRLACVPFFVTVVVADVGTIRLSCLVVICVAW